MNDPLLVPQDQEAVAMVAVVGRGVVLQAVGVPLLAGAAPESAARVARRSAEVRLGLLAETPVGQAVVQTAVRPEEEAGAVAHVVAKESVTTIDIPHKILYPYQTSPARSTILLQPTLSDRSLSKEPTENSCSVLRQYCK